MLQGPESHQAHWLLTAKSQSESSLITWVCSQINDKTHVYTLMFNMKEALVYGWVVFCHESCYKFGTAAVGKARGLSTIETRSFGDETVQHFLISHPRYHSKVIWYQSDTIVIQSSISYKNLHLFHKSLHFPAPPVPISPPQTNTLHPETCAPPPRGLSPRPTDPFSAH